jgi:hypothetical protein
MPSDTDEVTKPDSTNYVYCETCDIFFNKQLEDKANAKRAELKKGDLLSVAISLSIYSCPMCAIRVTASAESMSRSIEASHPHMRHRHF